MAKSGPQLHDYYFEKYELLTIQYPFNKKSESEKKHTLNFKRYNFRFYKRIRYHREIS